MIEDIPRFNEKEERIILNIFWDRRGAASNDRFKRRGEREGCNRKWGEFFVMNSWRKLRRLAGGRKRCPRLNRSRADDGRKTGVISGQEGNRLSMTTPDRTFL